MLQFETWKITLISLICVIGVVFSIPNLFSEEKINNFKFFNKQINLGLDLQGGSYILLEADMNNVFTERLESVEIEVKKILKDFEVDYLNLNIIENRIEVTFENIINYSKSKEVLRNTLGSDFVIIPINDNSFQIEYSDFARTQIVDLTISQAIEIVRRRIDESGTKEPLIQRQGNQRILIQLPGIDDPERIKSLLGKTAKLTFQLVDTNSIASEIEKDGFKQFE